MKTAKRILTLTAIVCLMIAFMPFMLKPANAEEFAGYQADVEYDASSEYVVTQTEATYNGLTVVPFSVSTAWWDPNVILTNKLGGDYSLNAAGLTQGSVAVLQFVNPIDSAVFEEMKISIGSNGGATFGVYNVNEIADGQLGEEKASIVVPHWSGMIFTLRLENYADENGMVSAIAFKQSTVQAEGGSLELAVSGFILKNPVAYLANVEYDASSENVVTQTATAYKGLNVKPFSVSTTWWDPNVILSNKLGGDYALNAAGLTKDAVAVLEFVRPIDSAMFEKMEISIASNGGATFGVYNVNEIADGQLGEEKESIAVPHWRGAILSLKLANYADANGKVSAIAFKQSSVQIEGDSLELSVSGFVLREPTAYQANVEYDANSDNVVTQTATTYNGLTVAPFSVSTTWWDQNVILTNKIGGDYTLNAAGLTQGAVVVLEFVNPIDSAVFSKLEICIGSNGGAAFGVYNVNEIVDGQLGEEKASIAVPHWSGATFTLKLADYADENGKVSAIAFKQNTVQVEGDSLELAVSGFKVSKGKIATETKTIEIAAGTNTKDGYLVHVRNWYGTEQEIYNDNHLLIFLPVKEFAVDVPINSPLSCEKLEEYNTLDNIIITLVDGTEKPLRELVNFSNGAYYNIMSERGTLGFSIGSRTVDNPNYIGENNYTAKDILYVTIKKGCEFPDYNWTNTDSTVKTAYVQTQDVRFFTDMDYVPNAGWNTNWGRENNLGKYNVTGVSYKDGFVSISADGLDYADGADNIGADSIVGTLGIIDNVYVNGISLMDRLIHFEGAGVQGFYNYDAVKGTFAVNVKLNGEEEINEIIVRKGARLPIFNHTEMGLAGYGAMYKTAAETVRFVKEGDTFVKQDDVVWTFVFDDGEKAQRVLIADGEMIAPDAIPTAAAKEGYAFKTWAAGMDGAYKFDAASAVNGCMYFVAEYEKKEATETPEDPKTPDDNEGDDSGCSGSLSSELPILLASMFVIGCLVAKTRKKENN